MLIHGRTFLLLATLNRNISILNRSLTLSLSAILNSSLDISNRSLSILKRSLRLLLSATLDHSLSIIKHSLTLLLSLTLNQSLRLNRLLFRNSYLATFVVYRVMTLLIIFFSITLSTIELYPLSHYLRYLPHPFTWVIYFSFVAVMY